MEVQHLFGDLIGSWTTPNIKRDKLSKCFNKLTSLEPAEFLDFYAYLSNKLIHYNIALLPFDAIDINYGYVDLCFPSVGERRYLQMTTEAFCGFDYTFPHEESLVQVASHKHGGHKPDGYRFLWDVMCHSQPVLPHLSLTANPSGIRLVVIYSSMSNDGWHTSNLTPRSTVMPQTCNRASYSFVPSTIKLSLAPSRAWKCLS